MVPGYLQQSFQHVGQPAGQPLEVEVDVSSSPQLGRYNRGVRVSELASLVASNSVGDQLTPSQLPTFSQANNISHVSLVSIIPFASAGSNDEPTVELMF
ncbi:hypothetical protein V6N13_065440 [Hibiscus sabdariffa]|uniref:Uncharacterized protein n=1 Tax=Hibiscus sabdariffa TaxID=183260 RepID=A0ABR2QR88_9ROSI